MKIKPMSTQTMQTVLEHCPTGVMALDRHRRVLWSNTALENLLGLEPDSLIGRDAQNLPRADLAALFSDDAHLTVLGVDGGPRHLFRTRVAGEIGDPIAELRYFADQSERVRLEGELARERETAMSLRLVEPETGLMSQRALMLVLEPQVARCRRYDTPLAAVVLNVKPNAAQPGVDARTVSQVLKDQLRWADLVGRDDNGDFLIVLPETGSEAATALADKLTQALCSNPHIDDCYFGIVEWVKSDNATGLLQRARAAMVRTRPHGGPQQIAR